MMRVYLTGFMGAGKTTVGECLARQLDVPFFDLDREIEQRSGFTVQQIFERGGEPSFRSLERRELERTLEIEDAVIATGGGTAAAPGNLQLLRRGGVSVWLNPTLDDLFERLFERRADPADSARPLLEDRAQAEALFQTRVPSYEAADLRVDVESAEGPDQIARRIRRLLEEARCDT
jgi:shikimate kinase